MKTELKDVLHLYLGQEMIVINNSDEEMGEDCYYEKGEVWKFMLINNSEFIDIQAGENTEPWNYGLEHKDHRWIAMWGLNDFKLLLRHLSDMTEEEIKQLQNIVFNNGSNPVLPIRINGEIRPFLNMQDPFLIIYLLKQGFDLFSLIDSGQAIDKTSTIIHK